MDVPQWPQGFVLRHLLQYLSGFLTLAGLKKTPQILQATNGFLAWSSP